MAPSLSSSPRGASCVSGSCAKMKGFFVAVIFAKVSPANPSQRTNIGSAGIPPERPQPKEGLAMKNRIESPILARNFRAISARILLAMNAFASILAASNLHAQTVSETGTATPLKQVVVTATRTPTATENVGSAVTVITREEIERSQARSVGELLRNAPAVAVVQTGRPGGQTSVFIRGANSNHTLFLIDGARINNPLNGLGTVAHLTPDQIERIEIISGPQSTLYGADALGGVINIITRSGAEKLTGSVAVEGGKHNTFRQFADVSGSHRKLDFALSVSHTDTDNAFANDDYENLTVGGKLGYRFNDRARASLTLRYADAEVGVPGAIPPGPNLLQRLQDEILFGRAAVDVSATDWWQQAIFVAHTHEDLRNLNVFPSVSRTDVTQIGWQHTLPVAEWHTIVAGLDWNQNQGDFSGFGQFSRTVRTWAGFAQSQVTFDRLAITGGGRFDSHSQFGNEFTYRFAGVLKFPETNTRLKTSAGTGFKAPTLNDLFFPGFSNPNLQPETSFGWDAGFEQDVCGGKATVGARYFEISFDDLITTTPDFGPPFLINVTRARTHGVEAFGEVRVNKNLSLRGNYTFLEAINLITNQPLLRRPKHSGSVGVDWRFCDRFELHTDATFVGPRTDVGNVRNAGYVKWDAALTADVTKHFQVFTRMENILNEKYEEAKGFPALGWTWHLGVRVKF